MLASPFPVLRGADFFPVADVPLAVFRVKNGSYARHGHDFHELVLVARGEGQHELFAPDSDLGGKIPLEEGSLVLIPAGWSHQYGKCVGLEIFNVLFAPHLLTQWPSNEVGFSLCDTGAKWTLQRGEREHLETLLQTIMRELAGRQRGFGIAASAKLAEVMVWLDRLNTHPVERRTPQSQEAVLQAVAFMEQNFTKPVVLADIARVVHLSPHYFCEVFKNAIGVSPVRYLLRLRLEHARYLLLTTKRPITEIARDAGFADPSYFARAFKTAFGTSPTRLRATGR